MLSKISIKFNLILCDCECNGILQNETIQNCLAKHWKDNFTKNDTGETNRLSEVVQTGRWVLFEPGSDSSV